MAIFPTGWPYAGLLTLGHLLASATPVGKPSTRLVGRYWPKLSVDEFPVRLMVPPRMLVEL